MNINRFFARFTQRNWITIVLKHQSSPFFRPLHTAITRELGFFPKALEVLYLGFMVFFFIARQKAIINEGPGLFWTQEEKPSDDRQNIRLSFSRSFFDVFRRFHLLFQLNCFLFKTLSLTCVTSAVKVSQRHHKQRATTSACWVGSLDLVWPRGTSQRSQILSPPTPFPYKPSFQRSLF